MKTLVVVSALVSLAIAAPTLPEDGTESKDTNLNWALQAQSSLLDSLTKERTPSEIAPVTHLHNGAPTTDYQNMQLVNDGASTPMSRSFLLKKPLIVKKKYGYQLYRDSEEEKAQADSNEMCGRQVKVKLCDENEKYRASMVSTDRNVDIHSSDDDVKHSIKMAKEAVENLQRDLKQMEMKTEMKTAHDSESEIELHEDIEVARRALKHIHDNFENLETMSLRATTTRNSENMHDVHLTVAKTEEERMAQWKEALENIQKNVEIARNIEDSFKTANNQENLIHLDQSNAASTILNNKMEETALLPETNQLRLAGDNLEVHNQEKTTQEEKMLEKTMNEHMGELIARKTQNADDDMNVAPSEMIEVHLDNKKHHESMKSESHKIYENAKNAEFELENPKTNVENKHLVNFQQIEDHHIQEKSAEVNTETLESVPTDFISADDNTKSLTLIPVSEQQRTVEFKENATENQQGKVTKMESDDVSDFILRSALNTEEPKMITEDIHNEHMVPKDVEDLNPEQKELLTETWNLKSKEALPTSHNEIKYFDTIPKSTETLENTHFLMRDNEHVEREKFIQDQLRQQWMQREELNQMETLQAMRAAEEHRLQNQKTIFWPQGHRHFEHQPSMKAAEDFDQFENSHPEQEHSFIPESTMDQFRNSYLPEHSHMPSKMGSSHISDLSHNHHHSHLPSRYHQNSMAHQHMHEMTGMGSAMHPHFLPHMRDAMEGFESEHTFHWQPTHESARSAYGSGVSSSISPSGAVGVFPNANVGGCGIPLLLSCSPSVVSGSLAKAHSAGPSSYSAPSYRTEDDFNFLTKRGIHMNDLRTPNTMRTTTTALKQNTPRTLENKA